MSVRMNGYGETPGEMRQHTVFPPGREGLRVPVRDRRSALAGLAMGSPSSKRAEFAHTLAWWGVRILGPRVLPGPRATWEPAIDMDVWDRILTGVEATVGRWDDMAVYERREGRKGFLFAPLSDGRPLAVVRIGAVGDEGVAHEVAALDRLEQYRPATFIIPHVLSVGEADGWTYAVLTSLDLGRHRMLPIHPANAVVDEIQASLVTLPRPDAMPNHWVPAHGDFAPWNFRTSRKLIPALLDWETSGWAPPGADKVYYWISAQAIGREVDRPDLGECAAEAIGYWQTKVSERLETQRRLGKVPPMLTVSQATLLNSLERLVLT